MRTVILIFLAISTMYGWASVESKIKKTSHELHNSSQNYKQLNKKMAKTAEAILQQKKNITKQQKQIAQLERELGAKEQNYTNNKKRLVGFEKQKNKLKTTADELEQELAFSIAKSVSLSLLIDEKYNTNMESIIELEVLKAKLRHYRKKIKKLNINYFGLLENIKNLNTKTKQLKNSIATIDAKRKKLLAIQKKNKKDLSRLKFAKSSYKKSLKKLLKKQDQLKQTLSRLNIVKIDEQKRKQEQAQQAKAFASKAKLQSGNMPKVKRYGKSYQSVKTKRYHGKKTIAPLERYTITKKYGTYTDPIYGIKVFNESISMKPKHNNAKVKNVFNGKIIYADKTSVLDNVVIVEHRDGLHTIYANLTKIAPNIKKGKKVKRGYIIGRVNDELIFEVTQKSSHVNPVRLFR